MFVESESAKLERRSIVPPGNRVRQKRPDDPTSTFISAQMVS